MSGFERWTNVGLTGVSSSRLGPRWVIVTVTACLAMIVVAMVGFRSGEFRGALVAIGLVGLLLLFLRTWFILTARTRRFLVARPDWTDLTRLALFLAVYVAIAAVGALAGFALILVMGALDQIAKGATATTSIEALAAGIGPGSVLVAGLSFPDRWIGNRT